MKIENLYRQVIMEHYKYPQNKGLVSDNRYLISHFKNPSCGDDIKMQLLIIDGIIKDIRHEGIGCSICCSSASVASATLKGKNVDDALEIIKQFYEMIKGLKYDATILSGDALAYQGVSKFPARIRCATLAWNALEQGIRKEMEEDNG